MIQVIVDLINSAKYSVDLVAYDLQNMRVGSALADAKRRGCRVRVITDIIHREHAPRFNIPMWDTLRSTGIISFDDAGTIYWPDGRIEALPKKLPNSGANLHHKFAVIDKLSDDPDDYYVWTGTMNLTYTGPWNTNSTLLIKDSGIALTYFEEFEQLWGSSSEIPNAEKARFHKAKQPVSNNIHWVNDTKVEVYFSPMNYDKSMPSISERITALISTYAKHDAHFLAFAISPNIPISQALWERSGRGEIQLKGVIDPAFYSRYQKQGAIWGIPEAGYGSRQVLSGKEIRKLHAKTLLLDANYPYPDKHTAITITGSYNFSVSAENSNDENCLIIHNNLITNQYYQDFMGVFNRAKGMSQHRTPPMDTTFRYDRFKVKDGNTIEVELTTNLRYPIRLLGVKAPYIWAGHKDSTFYFANDSKNYLSNLLKDATLHILGKNGQIPEHRYGAYYGYIYASRNDSVIFVNQALLENGHAQFQPKHFLEKDSTESFMLYEVTARTLKKGIWEDEAMIGTKLFRPEKASSNITFPIYLPTATIEELTALPTIGPARAQLIFDYIQDKKGKLKRLEELENIKGIGPATIEKIRGLVEVD
jgi:endonuclease YncB( thermonuclease family)